MGIFSRCPGNGTSTSPTRANSERPSELALIDDLNVCFHHELPYRWAFIALAVMSIVVGFVALVWPAATILVLAVLLGVRVFIEGLVLTFFDLGLRRLAGSI